MLQIKFVCSLALTLVLLASLGSSPAFGSSHPYPSLEFDPNVPRNVKKQFYGDLDALKNMRGLKASPLFEEIFGTPVFIGTDLVAFLMSRLRMVELDDCHGGATTVACVRYEVDPTVMSLTKNYLSYKIPQIFRISLILHESRHTERAEDFWLHERCPKPFLDKDRKDIVGILSGLKLEGERACDPSALGSYGLQAVFLKNVEKNCENCSEKMRMDAQLFGNDVMKRITEPTARDGLEDDLN